MRSGRIDNDKRNSKEKSDKNIDPVAEIRKYKELIDDGIITKEEFDEKKKQLLGM